VVILPVQLMIIDIDFLLLTIRALLYWKCYIRSVCTSYVALTTVALQTKNSQTKTRITSLFSLQLSQDSIPSH